MLFVGWCLLQITMNFIFATLAALVPDRVPDQQRGTVSGIVGLALPIGSIAGAIVIGQILKTPTISYAFLIVILLLILIPFSLILQDKILPRKFVAPFKLGAFMKNFWVDPRQHPDFGWAWLTRFLALLGYSMGTGYLFYYLQDYIKYERIFPGHSILQGISTLQIVGTLFTIVFIVIGGLLSDRLQRRKIFVVIASATIAVGLLILGLFPSWIMVLVAESVLGLGIGIYLASDVALITQVLPSAHDRGKDLGIINIATTFPQYMVSVIASIFITKFHSYLSMFLVSALITLLSGLLIQPIKSVR